MDSHEFGIMTEAPQKNQRFDLYEPEKYHVIAVDDDILFPFMQDFMILPCFAHTLAQPCEGLVYCGITLIPPTAVREMVWMVSPHPKLAQLTALLKRAIKENKYVIHFGI